LVDLVAAALALVSLPLAAMMPLATDSTAEQANSLESIPTQIVTAGELVSIKLATDSFSQTIQTIEICVSPGEIRSLVSVMARKSTIIGIRSQG
jgi:hypothetical protein